MDLCLYESNFGYYNNTPITNDYVTSPEISQLFGECICIWSILQWESFSKPSNLIVVELGPGLGTMMGDFLRFAKKFPEFYSSISVCMIERSMSLRSIQKRNLSHYTDIRINWADDIDISIDCPIVILANEFFDAMPVRQYIRENDFWYENRVINYKNEFRFAKYILTHNFPKSKAKIFEHSSMAENWFNKIENIVSSRNAKALIIDYGYIENPNISTIQGLKSNKHTSVLEDVGNVDITYHIDFSRFHNVVTQSEFLYKMGIKEMCEKLLIKANKRQYFQLLSGFDRLTSTLKMGSLFKVVELG